jgi:pimeloyl-ACP methyl ester carboxylesterase
VSERKESESWEQIPLILLSGMGADERILEPQIEKFPRLIVPKWIDPLPNESIPSYARRFAERIDPTRPCFIGGASFGGFVAVEMARHLDAKACFLIGSVKSADDLPLRVRILRPAAAATATIPV